MKKSRVVSATSSRHVLSFGPLRTTPVGSFTPDQLESAIQQLEVEKQRAAERSDELAEKRLATDERELTTELERRSFTAA